MVDGVVDAKETVMHFVERLHLDGLVLDVVLLKVERELLLDLLGVDGGGDFLPSLVEHRQHGVVNIIVEQHDAFLGRADEFGGIRAFAICLPMVFTSRWNREAICWRFSHTVSSFNRTSNLTLSSDW